MRGRKPKPERLRLLQEDGRIVGGATPPTAPAWLAGEALAEWNRVVAELSKTYLITPLDCITLAAYCESFALWRQAMREVAAEGLTTPTKEGVKANPKVKIAMGLIVELRRMASEFGFTPAARSRIEVPASESKEDDDFESFCNSGS